MDVPLHLHKFHSPVQHPVMVHFLAVFLHSMCAISLERLPTCPFLVVRSISVFRYVIEPGSRWLLEAGVQPWAGQAAVASLLSAFQLLYNALWLFPVYLISLVINCRWCATSSSSVLCVSRGSFLQACVQRFSSPVYNARNKKR